MRTINYNGEYWYADSRSSLRRIVEWIVWLGGLGTWRYINDRHEPLAARIRHRWRQGLAPVSLLGHRLTYYSWGASMRINGTLLTVVWRSGCPSGSALPYAYLSHDGTPQNAHAWLLNPPAKLVAEAREREHRRRVAQDRREGRQGN